MNSAYSYDQEYERPYAQRQTHPVRKKRRKRHRGVGGILLILFLITLSVLLGGLCFLLYRRIPVPEKQLSGNWVTSEDHTSDAAQTAQDWLDQAALGNTVHVRDYLPEILISAGLTIDGSSFSSSLMPETYEQAKKNAEKGLADALIELIRIRMTASESSEEISSDAVRELFANATGMQPEEYLASYGPRLLPSADEYAAACGAAGTFVYEEPYVISYNGQSYPYSVTDELLLLPVTGDLGRFGNIAEGRVIYRRISPVAESGTGEAALEIPLLSDLAEALSGISLPPLTLTAKAKTFRLTENLYCSPGAGTPVIVKAIHADYENNRYISLRDLAGALVDTPREFELSVDGNSVSITTGARYQAVGGENEPFADDGSYSAGDLKSNSISIDGKRVKYYTYMGKNTEGKNDCFINLTDVSLLFDINIEVTENGIILDTSERKLRIDMDSLRDDGFYDEMRGALSGNATTGEIYEEFRGDLAIPIASTTKLMTYAVVMDAVSAGEIHLDDTVILSANAAKLSQGPDRVIPMEQGQETNVRELMQGMLIASSNECALALAEHTAGSEKAFVERMQKKAIEIGLSENTVFNNCNGLPYFEDSISTAKKQNLMSAEDLFKLSSYLLRVYPQITEITSRSNVTLPTLHAELKSTNALLYNVPEVNGLKTGTTNMAGSCIVVSAHLEGAGGAQDLIAVVLGAEDNTVRFTSSEILIRYAMQCASGMSSPEEEDEQTLPSDAESLIRLVLSRA